MPESTTAAYSKTLPERTSAASVTLKAVALQAGVSQSVASTVLSGRKNNIRVTVETEQRVVDAARVLGYRARRMVPVRDETSSDVRRLADTDAKSQSLRPTLTVGVVTSFNPESSNFPHDPWESDIPSGLELALGSGTHPVITHYFNRGQKGRLPVPVEDAVAHLLSLNVNALVLIDISSPAQEVGRGVPVLAETGLPFVIISAGALAAPVANVYYDSVTAGYQAARHLIDQGYGEIVFLAPVRAPWLEDRISGACQALRHRDFPPANFRVFPDESERSDLPAFDNRVVRWDYAASGAKAAEQFLAQEAAPPRAVIAANDATAGGFIARATQSGFRLGIDYAVVGFDDSPEARAHSLTTLRPPRELMGREAATLLLGQIEGHGDARRQVLLNSHLMVRGSTPPCPASLNDSTLKTPSIAGRK